MSMFTGEQRDRIVEALRRVGATAACPRCGGERMSVVDGYLMDFVQRQRRNMVVGSNNRLICVGMMCDRCGFIAQHAVDALNLPEGNGEDVSSAR